MNLNPNVNASVSAKNNDVEQIKVKFFHIMLILILKFKIANNEKARYLENKKKIAEAKHVLENQKNEIVELFDNVKKATENSLDNKRLNMILHKAVNDKINSFSKDMENSGTSINSEFSQIKQENTSKVFKIGF